MYSTTSLNIVVKYRCFEFESTRHPYHAHEMKCSVLGPFSAQMSADWLNWAKQHMGNEAKDESASDWNLQPI